MWVWVGVGGWVGGWCSLGVGGECPRPITQKLLMPNEMKLGGVVKDH